MEQNRRRHTGMAHTVFVSIHGHAWLDPLKPELTLLWGFCILQKRFFGLFFFYEAAPAGSGQDGLLCM